MLWQPGHDLRGLGGLSVATVARAPMTGTKGRGVGGTGLRCFVAPMPQAAGCPEGSGKALGSDPGVPMLISS